MKDIRYSVFRSVSAFCNGGFILMGVREPFSSMTSYGSTVLMFLIITGGIGFLTWDDFVKHRQHFKKYRLQTKIVLFTTSILLVLPAIFFLFAEYSDEPVKELWLHSSFLSVTARTTGTLFQ